MEIFRVERLEDGNGPYGSMKVPKWYTMDDGTLYESHRYTYDPVRETLLAEPEGRPSPDEDGLAYSVYMTRFREPYFGFKDLHQARAWMGPVAHLLWEHYYDLFRYEVPDRHVMVGDHQVIFDRPHAKKLESLDPRILAY